jgi:hypothetical protein
VDESGLFNRRSCKIKNSASPFAALLAIKCPLLKMPTSGRKQNSKSSDPYFFECFGDYEERNEKPFAPDNGVSSPRAALPRHQRKPAG